ncbi:MAG: DNA lesion error-prone repair protein ImuA [Lysobacterales bacterium CG17_big_fil_post_rev_8_21_14_2_50_64_11]|nr:MAG: DNA lesion error-prone repair protein ImuA [Xanthomonadales bacterium CG17_big_fil_post_rev_8_21_14_2_50_64_11]
MTNTLPLNAWLADAGIFRGGRDLGQTTADAGSCQASQLDALDAYLPWAGFPRGALNEILIAHDGIGELSLLLPALCHIARRQAIAWVSPPYLPYPAALATAGLPLDRLLWIRAAREHSLWAAEQCLRAGCLGAVLVWTDSGDDRALRRLQVAAQSGASFAFLLRPLRHAGNASPAALRLTMSTTAGHTQVHVLKCRGSIAPAKSFSLDRTH